MSFYENFLRLCNAKGKTPSRVALEAGLTKGAVTRWKNGGGITDPAAIRLADYFGIPVEDLKGELSLDAVLYRTAVENGLTAATDLLEKNEHKKTAGQKADGLRGTGYEQLTPENKEVIDALIEKLLKLQSHE